MVDHRRTASEKSGFIHDREEPAPVKAGVCLKNEEFVGDCQYVWRLGETTIHQCSETTTRGGFTAFRYRKDQIIGATEG